VIKNVLIFPGGTEIAMEVWSSLRDCKDIALFSASSAISNHAPYVFANHFIVPDVHSKNWIEPLNEVISKNNIDFVIPCHDDVVLALAVNSNELNARIVSSPVATCRICRSKSKTYKTFRELLPVPELYISQDLSDIGFEMIKFPLFVKPDVGQGSQGANIVPDQETLKALIKANSDLIVLEYLPGKEYTIDCFSDLKRGLLFCGGRERIRTRAGISMHSKPVDAVLNQTFREYATIISKCIDLRGAWFFQVKEDKNGVLKLLEIAPRISGTMATHRVQGINFPLLSIYESELVKIEISQNNFDIEIDRALINRYRHNITFDKVYVDLDDTLILKNKVNTKLVQFLYQCVNKTCKIVLITKTVNDLSTYLKKWRLESLFDEILLLNKGESKADYIDPENSIFIDDSFSERKEVSKRYGIPTFDCSMVELLLDDKI
jgi:predicted ATP-grasp superfamily ATP-dependent carboligase